MRAAHPFSLVGAALEVADVPTRRHHATARKIALTLTISAFAALAIAGTASAHSRPSLLSGGHAARGARPAVQKIKGAKVFELCLDGSCTSVEWIMYPKTKTWEVTGGYCDGGTYKTVPKTKPKVTDFDDSRCAYSAFNWYAIKDGTGYGTSGEPGEVILEGNFIDSFWLQK